MFEQRTYWEIKSTSNDATGMTNRPITPHQHGTAAIADLAGGIFRGCHIYTEYKYILGISMGLSAPMADRQ